MVSLLVSLSVANSVQRHLTTALVSLGGMLSVCQAQANVAPNTPNTMSQTNKAKKTATLSTAIVAQIGQEKITVTEFDKAFKQRVAKLVSEQGIPFSPEILTEFTELRPVFLPLYIRNRAIQILAKNKVNLAKNKADEYLQQSRSQFKNDDAFLVALRKSGFENELEYREAYINQTLTEIYLQNLESRFKKTIRSSLISNYYNLHRKDFLQPATACVKHILLNNQQDAQEAWQRLNKGADFTKLAQKSQDRSSAAKGGEIGCIHPQETVAPFDKVSFSAPLNTPQLVKTDYGWHVLVISKRTEAKLLLINQASEQIRQKIAEESARKYLQSQIDKLIVKTFPEALKNQ